MNEIEILIAVGSDIRGINQVIEKHYEFLPIYFKPVPFSVVLLNNWDKWFGLFMTCFMTSRGSDFVGGEAISSHLCPWHEPFCHPLDRGVPGDTNCNST
jgi:hypothetical protein